MIVLYILWTIFGAIGVIWSAFQLLNLVYFWVNYYQLRKKFYGACTCGAQKEFDTDLKILEEVAHK